MRSYAGVRRLRGVLDSMAIPTRRRLLALLVAVFFAQTWLVYSDPAGRPGEPLSELASRGQRVWHRHNCQACHQLFGFGGFLGPDLTNLARRARAASGDEQSGPENGDQNGDENGGQNGGQNAEQDRERDTAVAALATKLEATLTTGSARMPAFHLGPDERLALAAFFHELDLTGVGQARAPETGQTPRELFEALVASGAEGAPLGTLEAAGLLVLVERGCIDCHLPNANSAFRATDLTTIHAVLDPAHVSNVLVNGLPQKGMPRLDLDASQLEATFAILAWLDANGEELRRGFEASQSAAAGSLSGLPWFEFR